MKSICETGLVNFYFVLQPQADPEVTYKSYLLNKVAQIFSLAFVVDYPQRWSSFFTDLFQSLTGPGTVDLYLRIMLAIDSEVVDREIVHSPQVVSVYHPQFLLSSSSSMMYLGIFAKQL